MNTNTPPIPAVSVVAYETAYNRDEDLSRVRFEVYRGTYTDGDGFTPAAGYSYTTPIHTEWVTLPIEAVGTYAEELAEAFGGAGEALSAVIDTATIEAEIIYATN